MRLKCRKVSSIYAAFFHDPMNSYTFDQLREQLEISFETELTTAAVDGFAAATGDISPVHMGDAFAQARGFKGRVVHGVLLGGLVSQMVGVHLPGENALLQSVNLMFLSPAYIGDRVRVSAVVDQLSESTRTMVLKVAVSRLADGQVLARGKAQVGFTQAVST